MTTSEVAENLVTIEIDGQRIEAQRGQMLIAASDRAGIYIPRFCYHEKLSIAANCRMCLVEVEKSPKPLPACATPIVEGMKVFTHSKLAREAQQGTLEFLLINHPLDCPVCDQGGECPLQDQAMGYGNDASRFGERKRVVSSHDIGPLVATEMTRCIHCTRCVRFGEEVAGAVEMGFPGRGEAAYIATFLDRPLDSEVSGNMIDLCPVGALTSKPYRFAARSWELENHRGISPHDCVGTNLNIQTLRGQVERVLPRDNPQVNACWLADRDRYSYEAVNTVQRLTKPMCKKHGVWRAVSWETALRAACRGLKTALADSGSDALGALAGYTSTLEEYYLLQKLTRALGSNHIDHRMQQRDFRDDAVSPDFPASELPIHQFDNIGAALLVGSNIRKEQPLLALRLRTAVHRPAAGGKGARISIINPLAYQQNFATETSLAVGAELPVYLAGVAAQLAKTSAVRLPSEIKKWVKSTKSMVTDCAAIAHSLREAAANGVVLIGALAQQHEDASVLRGIAQWICQTTGNRLAILTPGNSAAAWRAGCLPHRTVNGKPVSQPGYDVGAMFKRPRRAYLLLASNPQLDGMHGKAAAAALKKAEFVVCITAYQNESTLESEYADVLLPMSAFTESAGTFINCEGRIQHAEAAAPPLGESRPAWKILRVLGNFLDLPDFDYMSLSQVTAEITQAETEAAAQPDAWSIPPPAQSEHKHELQLLLDMPIYRGDQIVRNAPALQKTADNPPPAARLNQAMIEQLGFTEESQVVVKNGSARVTLPLQADARIPPQCVYVPVGYEQTAQLGGVARVTLAQPK